jgi:hypothetical protein
MNLKKPTPFIARHAPVREVLSTVIAVIAAVAKQSRMSRFSRAFPSFSKKEVKQCNAHSRMVQRHKILTPAHCDGGLA